MKKHVPQCRRRAERQANRAFTMIELLVVMAIIAMLAGLVTALLPTIMGTRDRTTALSNMRMVGLAFQSYAGDHDFEIPGRTRVAEADRWPKLLSEYVKDTRIFAAPGDEENWILTGVDPLSNSYNNTSFIMNGFNDLGALTQDYFTVRLTQLPKRQFILLGTPKSGNGNFYMDFLEGRNGNHLTVLDTKAYGDGSNYVFADGSARFIPAASYHHEMWVVNEEFVVPPER